MKVAPKILMLSVTMLIGGRTLQGQVGTNPTRAEARNGSAPRRARAAEGMKSMSPQQRAAFKTQREHLQAQVKAGTLTKNQARAQMKTWAEANRPATDGARKP